MSNLNPEQFRKIDPHGSKPEVSPMHQEMYPTKQQQGNNPWADTVPDREAGRTAVHNSLTGLYPAHRLSTDILLRHTTPN